MRMRAFAVREQDALSDSWTPVGLYETHEVVAYSSLLTYRRGTCSTICCTRRRSSAKFFWHIVLCCVSQYAGGALAGGLPGTERDEAERCDSPIRRNERAYTSHNPLRQNNADHNDSQTRKTHWRTSHARSRRRRRSRCR